MIGAQINERYLIKSELGRGGMGVVYRGLDLLLERPVAVKVVGPAALGSEGPDRLLREARAAASLNQPNIVAVYDAGQAQLPGAEGPSAYVVMELLEGRTLRDYRPAGVAEAVSILEQICQGLAAAHEQGIIHRDLKPENVALTAGGQVKLMDFGLARIGGRTRLTQDGTFMGTFDYLAPELIRGEEAGVQTDLYALGVLAYELLAGRRPFAADTPAAVLSQHLHAPVTPPSAHNEAITPSLDYLVVSLLNKLPQNRPGSASEVQQALHSGALDAADPLSPLPTTRLDFLVRGRLIGRERELAEAMAVWQRAAAGQRQVLLISGEPGIGKTRLATEISVQAQLSGARLLQGQCFENGGLPYMPLAQMIRLAFEVASLASLPPAVAADLGRLAPDLKLPAPEAETPLQIEAGDEGERLYESIVALCQVMTQDRPLLLFFDDLHWADSGTMAVLRHLVRRLPAASLMILATYREIELVGKRPLRRLLDDLRREAGAIRLKLGRLDRPQTASLLATLFAEEITAEFLEAIYGETEGNPFFVEEICKALVESGDLAFVNGQWRRSSMETIRLPESVQVTIEGRLEQLDDHALDVLRIGALLGREFQYEMVRVASELPEAVLVESLERSTRAQLVQESQGARALRSGGTVFSFTHALIQATLLSSLGRLRRQMLSRRLAMALEAAFTGQQAEFAPVLSRLFSESGDGEKAIPYLLQVADEARRLFAYEEAIEQYEQALLFLREGDDLDRMARVLMTIGATTLRAGQFDRSRQVYDEAFNLWRGQLRRPEAGRKWAPAKRAFRTHTLEPITLDPTRALDTASVYVSRQLFEGLVEIGAVDDVLPAAAASWRIEEGGRRYVFHLRDDAVWSDGEPVTAADFEHSWKRLLAPGKDTRLANAFFDIQGARGYHEGSSQETALGIRAENPWTLVVDLEQPVAYFLHLLASDPALPSPHHLVEKHGDSWTALDRIVTNGPFRPLSWEPGDRLILARNSRYGGLFLGNLEQVELRFSTDASLLEEYGAGKLDCLYASLLPSNVAHLAVRKFNPDLLSMPGLSTTYLAFDCGRTPFDDPRLRQAVNLAIDRRQLADSFHGGRADPALTGLIPPGMAGHGLGPRHVADREAARRLLAEAGYPGGKGLPRLTFYAVSHVAQKRATGFWLAEQLRDVLGLEIDLQLLPMPVLLSKLEQVRPDMLYLAWAVSYSDADSVLRGGDWPELCNWPHEGYVRLVEDGRKETDQAKRLELYRRAETILAEESPLVPLLHPRWLNLIKPWVRRFATSPTVWTIFRDVVLDEEG